MCALSPSSAKISPANSTKSSPTTSGTSPSNGSSGSAEKHIPSPLGSPIAFFQREESAAAQPTPALHPSWLHASVVELYAWLECERADELRTALEDRRVRDRFSLKDLEIFAGRGSACATAIVESPIKIEHPEWIEIFTKILKLNQRTHKK